MQIGRETESQRCLKGFFLAVRSDCFIFFHGSETGVWWKWVWHLCLSQCSESPRVTATWIQHRAPDPQGWEPPVTTRKNLVKSASAFIIVQAALWLLQVILLGTLDPKKKSMQMNTTSSKLCLFCKMQVTWKIAEFIFCSLSWLLGFSSCYLFAIFFRLSKLSSIWQFTPEFGVKGNIIYSVFILPGAEAPGSLWVLQP